MKLPLIQNVKRIGLVFGVGRLLYF